MQRNLKQLRFSALRQAFTLVELLVVCAIIGILVTLTVVTVNMVSHSAKVTKTRATIQKLDTALLQIFESYENKFNDIKRKVEGHYPPFAGETPGEAKTRQQKIAAHFIRDLMRMEMPQSWTEVYDSNNPGIPLGPMTAEIDGRFYSDLASSPLVADPYPAQWVIHYTGNPMSYPLLNYYWQEYDRVVSLGGTPSRAALLFLVIQNLNPEALEAFHGSEVAQNGDGMLEFIDAWGRPIHFLRWTPAFSDSDLQQNVLKNVRITNEANWRMGRNDDTSDLWGAMLAATVIHPDPTDERRDSIGWFLYPLIYSAGADGRYGIEEGNNWGSPVVGSEGILDPFEYPYGMPSGSEHFDNIHNHQRYRSF